MKVTHKNSQDVVLSIILDRSGSMAYTWKQTLDSFSEYINALKKDDNNYRVTLTVFDDRVAQPLIDVPIKKVDASMLEDFGPRGMTALYDAIGKTLNSLNEEMEDEKVLVVIITDGGENASKEFNRDKIARMIREAEDKGNYTFVFLAANQDSWQTAQTFGLQHRNNVVTYDASNQGTQAMMRGLQGATMSFASSEGLTSLDFFDGDIRSSIEGTK